MMENIKFKVVSDSMTPLIPIGSELNLIKQQNSMLNPFDIIVFKRDSKLIAHYVWRNQIAYNGTIITRSLKEKFIDEPPIPQHEILGLVKNYKIGFLNKVWILFMTILTGRS